MISTEVKRTLVKSPPELWSELSDQDSLARHLSELGEVRITRSEPEQLVEWEAEHARGRVQIEASGWGTKVTLNVTRELPSSAVGEPQPSSQAPELEREPASEPTPEPQTAAEGEHEETQPSPVAQTQSKNEDEDEAQPSEPAASEPAMVEPEPAADTAPEPTPSAEPRRGFFARLFKRRGAPEATAAVEPTGEPATSSDLEPVEDPQTEPEPSPPFQALAAPEPIYPDPPPKPADPPADIAAELTALEAQIELDTTELLTAILDRLGAAHHRPFSRA